MFARLCGNSRAGKITIITIQSLNIWAVDRGGGSESVRLNARAGDVFLVRKRYNYERGVIEELGWELDASVDGRP